MKNKETKLINEAWQKLEYYLNHQDWTSHGDQLLNLTLEESKGHDRFRGGERNTRGISVRTEAKFFAVKRLVDYINGDDAPDPANYISTQKSCFHAYGLVRRFSEGLTELHAQKKELFDMVASWDYCDLIKAEDRRKDLRIAGERVARQ